MCRYDNDDPIPPPKDTGVPGGVKLSTKCSRSMVPLKQSELTVILNIEAGDSINERDGLDLVAVLDVSESMKDDVDNNIFKLTNVKTAMQFVIKKLSPIDRLSVVTFSQEAKQLFPLRQINKDSRRDLEEKINKLNVESKTNVAEGLETGLRVLDELKFKGGRMVGIILMSDGKQNVGDATKVPIGDVPVFTFGFGDRHQPELLRDIAAKSLGGTFSEVQDTNNFNKAFSKILALFHSVFVRDLRLTVMRCEYQSKIKKITAGNYPNFKIDDDGSETIRFGFLSNEEMRTVTVDLDLLPATSEELDAKVLEITYSYRIGRKQIHRNHAVTVSRTDKYAEQQESPEAIIEKTRHHIAEKIGEASKEIGEARKSMEEARKKDRENKTREAREAKDKANQNSKNAKKRLSEAQQSLQEVNDDSNQWSKMTKVELHYIESLQDPSPHSSLELYITQACPFIFSLEISFNRQRFAARGDVESPGLFATRRMDKYAKQAKLFESNRQPPPSVDEDVKEELAANPLPPFAGALRFYIQELIKSLQGIEKLLE